MSYPLLPSKSHPRLFITAEQIETLRPQVETDPVSKRMFDLIRRTSDLYLDLPPQERIFDISGALLLRCRNVGKRLLFLGLTAQITGDTRYARRAVEEMMAVAAFEDWGRKHFLDVGEMTFAMAVGYDWLYDHLSPAQRDIIATAIIEKGLKLSFLDDRINWWVDVPINWNQVCHAGMTAGALVVAEREPELAARIVARTLEKVAIPGATYAPDGAHPEGPMYWAYGTAFHCAVIAMLESALGHDGGLADAPGFPRQRALHPAGHRALPPFFQLLRHVRSAGFRDDAFLDGATVGRSRPVAVRSRRLGNGRGGNPGHHPHRPGQTAAAGAARLETGLFPPAHKPDEPTLALDGPRRGSRRHPPFGVE